MERRSIPVIITLVAGAISLLISMFQNYSLLKRTIILFFTFLIFYLLSSLLIYLLDYFDEQNEKKKQLEGEMVEKESSVKKDNPEEKSESIEKKEA